MNEVKKAFPGVPDQKIKPIFNKMDKNHDGFITKDEMPKGENDLINQ